MVRLQIGGRCGGGSYGVGVKGWRRSNAGSVTLLILIFSVKENNSAKE